MSAVKPTCSHDNCMIEQEITTNRFFTFASGVCSDLDMDISDETPTGSYTVICYDCGLDAFFDTDDRKPEWLKAKIKLFGTVDIKKDVQYEG